MPGVGRPAAREGSTLYGHGPWKFSKVVYIRFMEGFCKLATCNILGPILALSCGELCKGFDPRKAYLCKTFGELRKDFGPNYVRVLGNSVRGGVSRGSTCCQRQRWSLYGADGNQQHDESVFNKKNANATGSAFPMERQSIIIDVYNCL